MINVLVDGVGGDVGQGVLKSLQRSSIDITLYAACISNSSSWLYKIDRSFIFPLVSDADYIDFLIDFLNKHKIDVYFPTIDSTLRKLSKYKSYIEKETDTIVFIDNVATIDICDNKYKTIEFLKNNSFDFPKSIDLLNLDRVKKFTKDNIYPLILKSKSGNGAKDVILVNDFSQVKPYIGNNDWMLQEYLNIENEITCGVYIGDDKKVKNIYILKRELKCGSTYKASSVQDLTLESKLIDIAQKMDMKYINIQAVYDKGNLYPFEFNGRMSGTTGAMSAFFNVAENFIKERILTQQISENFLREKVYFARYYEEVIYSEGELDKLEKRSK